MRLVALELAEWRQMRILVRQVDDEADGHQRVALLVGVVVLKRSAAGFVLERPSLRVDDEPRMMPRRVDLPQLFQSDSIFLEIDAIAQVEFVHQALRQRSANAFGEQRVLRVQLHPFGVFGLVRSVLCNSHVAGCNALDRAIVVVQDLGRREARINLDAERLGLSTQPATDIAQADDVVAVVVQQRRHRPVRDAEAAGLRENEEAVLRDLRRQRRTLLLPVGDQLVERDGIDHRTREDMRADFRSLLEDAD